MDIDSTALLVIDVQKGLDHPGFGKRNNPDAEKNIALLLDHWRLHRRQVIHVRHSSTEPGSPLRPELPGHDYKDEALPLSGELQLTKTVNSAFIGTGLEQILRRLSIGSLVIVGLTTDHCVSTSVRMAANLGFDVMLVSDATAAHEKHGFNGKRYSAELIHSVNLVSLDGEFCTIRTTGEIMSECR